MTSADHRRLSVLRSLDGLSVGDAFGECFFAIALDALLWQLHLETQTIPPGRWRWTDDTAMAISVLETLYRFGAIEQNALASAFADRYMLDDRRGYGATAHGILMAIHAGEPWQSAASNVFHGQGSMGNGGAMRASPLGVYFADDVSRLVVEARKSAEVTHKHPEGQAGAVAVALAAAFMTNRGASVFDRGAFFDFILQHTPESETRIRISQAKDFPDNEGVSTIAAVVGNGSGVVAPDTVPFSVWCAARHPDDFETALWTTVSGGGDMDTNCAIVGGIISANDFVQIPSSWLSRREKLPVISEGFKAESSEP